MGEARKQSQIGHVLRPHYAGVLLLGQIPRLNPGGILGVTEDIKMMPNILRAAVILSIVIIATGIAQDDKPSPIAQEVLSKQIGYAVPGMPSPRDAFVQVLSATHVPGGMELNHCGDSGLRVLISAGSSLKTALEQITTVQPQLRLDVSDRGVVNLLGHSEPGGVLGIRIGVIHLSDIRGNPMASVREILETPEVITALARLRLHEGPVRLGLGKIRRPGAPVPAVPAAQPVTFRDVSVRDILNAIAESLGAGVWVYEEFGCTGDRTFRLSFGSA